MKLLHGFLFPRNRRYFSMTNITTQRLALGVLMAFVLAFGMIEAADALELEHSSGDFQTVATGEDFEIRFSVRLDRNTDGESLQIDAAAGDADATIDEVNRRDEGVSGSTHDMYERDNGDAEDYGGDEDRPQSERLSGSVTVKLIAPDAAGVITVEIEETTTGVTGNSIEFTIFVVQDETDTFDDVTAISFPNRQVITSTRDDRKVPISFTVTGSTNVAVTLTVSGSGRLLLSDGTEDRETRGSNRLETSSAAGVSTLTATDPRIYLDVNNGSSLVTLEVAGADPVTTVFIFGIPTITLINDDQTGVQGGRLSSYLGAQLSDSRGRGVSGAIISFASTAGMFLPVPGTTVYIQTNGYMGRPQSAILTILLQLRQMILMNLRGQFSCRPVPMVKQGFTMN